MVIKQRKSSNKVSDKYSLEKKNTQVLNPDKRNSYRDFFLCKIIRTNCLGIQKI